MPPDTAAAAGGDAGPGPGTLLFEVSALCCHWMRCCGGFVQGQELVRSHFRAPHFHITHGRRGLFVGEREHSAAPMCGAQPVTPEADATCRACVRGWLVPGAAHRPPEAATVTPGPKHWHAPRASHRSTVTSCRRRQCHHWTDLLLAAVLGTQGRAPGRNGVCSCAQRTAPSTSGTTWEAGSAWQLPPAPPTEARMALP